MDVIEKLESAVAHLRVQPPLPAWCKPSVPEIEEMVEERERDHSSGWAGFIRYTDSHGNLSERRIVCRAIKGYGEGNLVMAYCFERRALRSFRIDRITELVCLDTGEVLDPQQHFDELQRSGALRVIDKALADLCLVLVFMAKCDGSFHPLERESIEDALERYVVRFGGDERAIHDAVSGMRKLAPDGIDFANALRRLRKHPSAGSLARLLRDSMRQLVDADGILDEQEVQWALVVNEVLADMARPQA